MTIPDYQTLMLPFLQVTRDHLAHRLSEVVEKLADQYQLSSEEQQALLPCGTQKIFTSRVSWAGTYLKKAQLITSPVRGIYYITPLGEEVLKDNPEQLDKAYLSRFSAFNDFVSRSQASAGDVALPLTQQEQMALDPKELLERSYQTVRQEMADELLTTIKQASPVFFEHLVVELLMKMGYGGSHQAIKEAVCGRSGDRGIDGVINQDPLGLEQIYIQAKRWEGSVGSPVLQGFAGSMDQFHAQKGVLLTTSTFTADARQFAKDTSKKIALIDGQNLVSLMLDHGVGVTVEETYRLHKVDTGYFELA
jgi:restriction system protein